MDERSPEIIVSKIHAEKKTINVSNDIASDLISPIYFNRCSYETNNLPKKPIWL